VRLWCGVWCGGVVWCGVVCRNLWSNYCGVVWRGVKYKYKSRTKRIHTL
jgi:hypothetical protein